MSDGKERPWTPGPWSVARLYSSEQVAEFEKLGMTVPPEHERWMRDNDGAFIVMGVDADGEPTRVASTSFKGSAKRGQTYKAPDPEGLANATLSAAAPDLYEALRRLVELKDAKDRDGATTAYQGEKVIAWSNARLALSRANPQGEEK